MMGLNLKYLFFIAIIFVSCSKMKIADYPITKINEKPLQIDTSEYKLILSKFNLKSIDKASDYLGGLTPKYKIAIVYSDINITNDSICMNKERDMSMFCRKILIKKANDYELINRKDDLIALFAPIQNEEEALSYVSLYTDTDIKYSFQIKDNFRFFVRQIYKSYARKIKDGFETITYDYDAFGCGPHSHYMVKNFVDFEGNVKLIEEKKVYENPGEDGLCVD